MSWLAIPLGILAIAVIIQGWPSFVTINHYHGVDKDDAE